MKKNDKNLSLEQKILRASHIPDVACGIIIIVIIEIIIVIFINLTRTIFYIFSNTNCYISIFITICYAYNNC